MDNRLPGRKGFNSMGGRGADRVVVFWCRLGGEEHLPDFLHWREGNLPATPWKKAT